MNQDTPLSNPTFSQSNDEVYCPICAAMDAADKENRTMDLEDFRQAFREAKRLGYHAGEGKDL